jgi:guanine deaminase
MKSDKTLLQYAINLAAEGILKGCGPFGAVIVQSGKVIAEANNRVVISHDPTAHAEVMVIREAAKILNSHDLSGCIVYSSCEPCPMCLGAIYWAGIKKVFYASSRLEAAKAGFSDNFIYDEILLDPSERSVSFIHQPDAGGGIVFKKWNDFEEKIQY